MSKMSVCQQVKLFARQNGMSVNGKGGIPVLSKGDWVDCFNNWQDAYDFIVKARQNAMDKGGSVPWN